MGGIFCKWWLFSLPRPYHCKEKPFLNENLSVRPCSCRKSMQIFPTKPKWWKSERFSFPTRAFADPISIQTIIEVRMVLNAVPSWNTFFVRDIQEKASNGCHSAFVAWNVAPKKEKNFSIRKSQFSALERGRISTKSENDQNYVCLILFFVEISATKGDRDLVLFSLIKIVAAKKEKKLFETKYSNLDHFWSLNPGTLF